MKLHLIKPLAFIDLETTGVDVSKDRIVQIAVLKVFPDGKEVLKTDKVNPIIPIPLHASLVHGIYDHHVQSLPTFAELAQDYINFIDDSDLAGFNSNRFDIPLLVEEFLRAGIFWKLQGRNLIDVQTIFHLMEKRNLKAAYKFYCGEELVDAHDAVNDIIATYQVLKAQIAHYENVEVSNDGSEITIPIKNDMGILNQFTNQLATFNFLDPTGKLIYDAEKQVIVFNFGKYKGRSLQEVFTENPSYYDWMMNKADFSLSTRRVLKKVWDHIHKK